MSEVAIVLSVLQGNSIIFDEGPPPEEPAFVELEQGVHAVAIAQFIAPFVVELVEVLDLLLKSDEPDSQ